MSSVRSIALAAVFACGTLAYGTASAGVVVSSSGPSASSYPVGKKLGDDERIVLARGDTLTVLDNGGTRVLRGAGTYTLGQQAGRARSDTFAVLTRQGAARRVRTGAVRVGDGASPDGSPNLWYVNVRNSGTHCLAGPDGVRLWRSASEGEAAYTVRPAGAESSTTVNFGDGETLLAWGNTTYPITDQSSFEIAGPGGAKVSVTFMLLGEMPGDAEGLAERLIAKGCANQLELLSTAMLVEEAGGGGQPG